MGALAEGQRLLSTPKLTFALQGIWLSPRVFLNGLLARVRMTTSERINTHTHRVHIRGEARHYVDDMWLQTETCLKQLNRYSPCDAWIQTDPCPPTHHLINWIPFDRGPNPSSALQGCDVLEQERRKGNNQGSTLDRAPERARSHFNSSSVSAMVLLTTTIVPTEPHHLPFDRGPDGHDVTLRPSTKKKITCTRFSITTDASILRLQVSRLNAHLQIRSRAPVSTTDTHCSSIRTARHAHMICAHHKYTKRIIIR